MPLEYVQKQLETWKRLMLVGLGASITLLAITLADTLEVRREYSSMGWFAIWFMLQLALSPAGFAILFGKGWRVLTLAERLNTAFGHLAAAWITWLAFRIAVESSLSDTWTASALNLLVLGPGAVLAVGYWRMRRLALAAPPEEMFP